MTKRYFELETHFSTFERDPGLAVYLPAPFKNNLLENLLNHFTKLNSVTKALKREEITIFDTRALFDDVIKSHPWTSKYLASDASIVYDVVFESAITKIQKKNERFVTEEVLALKMMKKNEDEQASATSTSDDLAQNIIKKKRMCDSGSHYEGNICVLPTSNIVERFFNTAGIALSDYGHRLLPANMEYQLILKYNCRLWDKKTQKFVINHLKIAEQ